MDALSLEEIWWRYPTFSQKPSTWTLKDISLQIRQGECFGITGHSGAGKTTLCRTILGILPTSARLTSEQLPHHFRGSVSILGQQVGASPINTKQIGMVLQDPENQFLRMSLLHELGVGLQFQGLPREEILMRAEEALRQVGLEQLWPGAFYRHPSELSGGQKQRIAIASFLAMRPQILILDEPTSDLDPVGKHDVIETIARLRREHAMTILLVEQDPDILSTFCDRIALLNEGRVELVAPPAKFYAEQAILERCGASVGELTRISWRTGYRYQARPPLNVEEAEQAFAPALSSLKEPSRSLAAPQQAIIEAKNVHYRYEDGTTALSGVDLTLYPGEILALLGPNGSGKTTFAKILAGIFRSASGSVRVLGQDLSSRRARRLLPSRVGYVFQNPDHQIFQQSVRSEIEYGLKNLDIDAKRRHKQVSATLEAVGLTRYAEENPLFLSKGQRQRLAVAALLAMSPEILIIDEPTTGQDARSILALMKLLSELRQQGKTLLIITHDMTLVAEYCQRVVAFQQGKVSFTGTPAELFNDEQALQVAGLRAPTSATLAQRMRIHNPQFPPLLTVVQWVEALNAIDTAH